MTTLPIVQLNSNASYPVRTETQRNALGDRPFAVKVFKLVPQFHAEAVAVLVATTEADHRVAAEDDRVGQRQLVTDP